MNSTAAVTEPTTVSPYSITLLGYSKSDFEYLSKLINQVNLGRPVKFYGGDLAKYHNVDCDLVIVVIDNAANINRYIKDISDVKNQSPAGEIIICTAQDKDRKIIENNKDKIEADEILFLPMQPQELAKAIMVHLSKRDNRRPQSAVPTSKNPESAGSGGPVRLGDLLVKSKLITGSNLKTALDHQKKTGQRLGDVLINLGFITEEQKLACLASQLDLEIATARQYASVDLNIAALIPEHMAKRFCCLALEKNGGELLVVMTDALDLKMLDTLRDATDLRILPVLGKKDDIETSIERCYRDISSHNDATKFAESMEEEDIEVVKKEEDLDLEQSAAAGAEIGIVKLVNILITNAIRDKASDIHIEPMETEVVVRYRIDGDMRKVMSPPKRSHHAIVARIKILSDLNIAERRLPQDGRMAIKLGSREVDIRVSILPTIFGEKAVLRILDKEAFEKSTSNLGFTPHDDKIFRSQIAKPYGIVMVTGPTGSGKSTTLYSALQIVKDVTKNVITVEDPVEFHMAGINQVHVNSAIGLTFGAALRSILRQDPDVILIGEIRDSETADIATKMALTGHLVFSTLHTNDAASSIARLVDIGVPPILLGSSINLIIAQRLVRRICTKCKVEYVPDHELLEGIGLPPEAVSHLYKGTGCVACNGTGFAGRIAIFEMLEVSKTIRKLILKGASTIDIQEQAEKEGMKTLRKAGLELAINGTTTIEQIIAATMEI
ncbi:MAG: Flp pilus assembly complex ATPase component TadA [Chitinispirillales bacterium]|jgi:type IV pilus assembly protein PilB|nr:Flp pilus assembly complex ATPase component TadA [Chitinispirillales bacterium]